jgi:hypothetical protein
MGGDLTIPLEYHLEGPTNYGVWAFRIQHLLQRDGNFVFCTTPPPMIIDNDEREARSRVMSILISNVKGNALKFLKRYREPYECWTDLKFRYESDNGPRRHSLLDKLFNFKKIESMTMDSCLVDIRNITDTLEEIGYQLPEDTIVYCTIASLPKEYTVFKRMYGGNELPSFRILETKLLSKEQAIAMESEEKGGEALAIEGRRNYNIDRRPTGRFGAPIQRDRGLERSAIQYNNQISSYHTNRNFQSSYNPDHQIQSSYTGSGNIGPHRANNHAGSTSNHRPSQNNASSRPYQHRYRTRGPDQA